MPRLAEPFLVVGIGASAGGIGALKEFFRHVPATTGNAYVVILHLSPEHESIPAGMRPCQSRKSSRTRADPTGRRLSRESNNLAEIHLSNRVWRGTDDAICCWPRLSPLVRLTQILRYCSISMLHVFMKKGLAAAGWVS